MAQAQYSCTPLDSIPLHSLKPSRMPSNGSQRLRGGGCCPSKPSTDREKLVPSLALNRASPRKTYAAFISHFKAEAAMEARFLHDHLQTRLMRQVFLDSDDLSNLSMLRANVLDSEVLVLVQSRGVFERPWCIIELMLAVAHDIPIVGVSVVTGAFPYDFGAASLFLENLDSELERRNPGACAVLRDEGVDPTDAAWQLSTTIPKIISTAFNPSASNAILHATIQDLSEEIRKAKPLTLAPKDAFLQRRELRGQRVSGSSAHGSSAHHVSRLAIPPEVPQLPPALQIRPELLDALRKSVLRQCADGTATGSGRRTSLVGKTMPSTTTTAHGMGGVGKTVAAAQLIRDAEVGANFERLLWVSVGQEPNVLNLLKILHVQLCSAKMPTWVDQERDALQVLREAAKDVTALLVLDDVWSRADADALHFLEPCNGSACVLTTRVRNLSDGEEVSCGLLSVEESIELLLSSAGLDHLVGRPPPAAYDAVECCGRLALALPIAGGMVRELDELWEEELVPMLKQDLSHEISTEERIVNASLRCIAEAHRAGVEALFEIMCCCFAEDTLVPISALDVLAPLVCERAGALEASKLKVRKWLAALLKASLLIKSDAGVSVHDLVRDVIIRRITGVGQGSGHGALLDMRRTGLSLLISAFDEEETKAQENKAPSGTGPSLSFQRSELRQFITRAVAHLVANAQRPGAPLHEDALLIRALSHSQRSLCFQAVTGFGLARLRAATEACEAINCWLVAARLWMGSSAGYTRAERGSSARDPLMRAWNAVGQVQPETTASRALEARILGQLIYTDPRYGSAEHNAIVDRAALVCEQIQSSSVKESDGAALDAGMEFDVLYGRALACHWRAHRLNGISGQVDVFTITPSMIEKEHQLRCEVVEQLERAAERTTDPARVDEALNLMTEEGIVFPGLHSLQDFDKDFFCGPRGSKLRANIERYDFELLHFEHAMARFDTFLLGHNEAGLLLFYGDLEAARTGWAKQIDAWKKISIRLERGEAKCSDYFFETLVGIMHVGAGAMLAAGEMAMLCELIRLTPPLMGLHNAALAEDWQHSIITHPWLRHYEKQAVPMMTASTFRLWTLAIDALVAEGPADEIALRAWLPSPDMIMSIAAKEYIWCLLPSGAAHPCILCARLYADRLGAWKEAAMVATGFLELRPLSRTNQICRIEAWRLLARCHHASGDKAGARTALESALNEAKAARYAWFEHQMLEEMKQLVSECKGSTTTEVALV